jgi:hypothetical protein
MHIVWTVADAARSTKSLAPESRKRCFASQTLTASFPLLGLSAFWPGASGCVGDGQKAQKVLRYCGSGEATLLNFLVLVTAQPLKASKAPRV